MGRNNRHFVSDGIYHLIQRGHNKSFIFNAEADKTVFLNIIAETKRILPFELLYYVLMNNHFHLVVRMQTEPISRVMHRISLTYSKYYNRMHQCSGSAYGQRFHAFNVHDRKYLLQLILYIANNPVRAGLVTHPSQYRWCAHKEISSKKDGLVSVNGLLETLGATADEGATVYGELIKQNFFPVSQAKTNCDFMLERRSEQMADLLDQVAKTFESVGGCIGTDLVRSTARDPIYILIRHDFIRHAATLGFKTNEIAGFLNVTNQCVKKVLLHGAWHQNVTRSSEMVPGTVKMLDDHADQ